MNSRKSGRSFLVVTALLIVILLPGAAFAQSTIAGLVSDATGGVLPGVTVEAASPALIEKVRTAITDGEGRYSIVNLRPGVYVVTFTLTGFSTVKRESVEVAAGVNVPINVELRVGALEETVTVSGATPGVDIQAASRTQVLSREQLDILPSNRNSMTIGSMLPGVKLSRPDVAGSGSMDQIRQSVHGSGDQQQYIDGMLVSSYGGAGGGFNQYNDDAIIQEVSVQTSANGAEN